jgi:hypothetical protein
MTDHVRTDASGLAEDVLTLFGGVEELTGEREFNLVFHELVAASTVFQAASVAGAAGTIFPVREIHVDIISIEVKYAAAFERTK